MSRPLESQIRSAAALVARHGASPLGDTPERVFSGVRQSSDAEAGEKDAVLEKSNLFSVVGTSRCDVRGARAAGSRPSGAAASLPPNPRLAPTEPGTPGLERSCSIPLRASRWIASLVVLVAAALLVASLTQPLWRMRMEAPQYRGPEALQVAVYPNALRGDLNEIKVLNQYIGVHIPAALPQLKWLPTALLAAAALGLLAAFLPIAGRRRVLTAVPALLTLALLVAAVQAQAQMYDIGHKRDAKTKLAGVKDFTPPLLGKAKIAQFEVRSSFGLGAYLIGAAVGLQFAAAWLNRARKASDAARRTKPRVSVLEPSNPPHQLDGLVMH